MHPLSRLLWPHSHHLSSRAAISPLSITVYASPVPLLVNFSLLRVVCCQCHAYTRSPFPSITQVSEMIARCVTSRWWWRIERYLIPSPCAGSPLSRGPVSWPSHAAAVPPLNDHSFRHTALCSAPPPLSSAPPSPPTLGSKASGCVLHRPTICSKATALLTHSLSTLPGRDSPAGARGGERGRTA